jgi:hypothetical protein
MAKGLIAVLLSATVCFGCAAGQIQKPISPEEMREIEAALAVGTSKTKVRELLGDPIFEHSGYGLEAYRLDSRETKLLWILYYPLGWQSRDHDIYMLVRYDEHESLRSLAYRYYVDYDQAAVVELDGYTFMSGPADQEPIDTVIAPPDVSAGALDLPPPSGRCALFLMVPGGPDFVQGSYFMDGSPLIDLDVFTVHSERERDIWQSLVYRNTYTLEQWKTMKWHDRQQAGEYLDDPIFARIDVPIGDHLVEVGAAGNKGRVSGPLTCEEGQRYFASVVAHRQPTASLFHNKHYLLDGHIEFIHSLPEYSRPLRQLLFHLGQPL